MPSFISVKRIKFFPAHVAHVMEPDDDGMEVERSVDVAASASVTYRWERGDAAGEAFARTDWQPPAQWASRLSVALLKQIMANELHDGTEPLRSGPYGDWPLPDSGEQSVVIEVRGEQVTWLYMTPDGHRAYTETLALDMPQAWIAELTAGLDAVVTRHQANAAVRASRTPRVPGLPDPVEPAHLALMQGYRPMVDQPPAWSADGQYRVGDVVEHDGRAWVALPDVATYPPDDAYDEQALTGGWMPL